MEGMLERLMLPHPLTSDRAFLFVYMVDLPASPSRGDLSKRRSFSGCRYVIPNAGAGGIMNCGSVRSFGQWKKTHSAIRVAESGSSVLDTEDKENEWQECKQLISALNFSPEEAAKVLGKAFGWENSPYWGEERIKEIPQKESVQATLDHLKNLGLSGDDLHKVLKKFPEVLGCDLDGEVKPNLAVLDKEWGISGKTLRSLLLRNPKVLGYNVDCKGDCIAKCTRCWVRF